MKRTILVFGLISGAISSLMMVSTIPFLHKIGTAKGAIVGYTAIVLSFMLVFFGIRSYRENVGNGEITFGRAFLVGIGITLISCAFYVATWEIIYFKLYKTQIPIVEQAMETAALMLGTDKSRGYCLEMICADFLAGANLDNDDPTLLLQSISRFFKFLPGEQRQAFLHELTEKAS
jgi:hypothetical protein